MKRLFSPKKLRILFLALAVVVQAAVIVIPYVFLKHYIVRRRIQAVLKAAQSMGFCIRGLCPI